MNGRHRRAVPSSIVDGAVPESRPLTAGRSRFFASWALALTLTAIVAKPAAAQLVASPNVNVAGGPACLKSPQDPSCRAQVFGDVSMQRQNELSMACSSRNPQTCLAAGNDYRLIGLPGVDDGKVTADAWMGIFWTRNAGQSWRSSLLPGWKTSDPLFKDTTPEGAPAQNPIAGFEAAADATVRAGTHGLFYVSGIAFNRADEANGTSSGLSSGGEGKSGVQFVATFIDDNNTSDPNVPPRFLRISIVDSGTSRAISRQAVGDCRRPARGRELHHPGGTGRQSGSADHFSRCGVCRVGDVPRQRQQSPQRHLGQELERLRCHLVERDEADVVHSAQPVADHRA